ncbi:MAG: biopolymer transporter ExbD [Lentisphaeria bacterium]|nr:biopolymer transporter ExbD [Lentisphaeria bacterium]NQZ71321.1 biopolymer transporter ExbD [Lentisphaeria bacterium]
MTKRSRHELRNISQLDVTPLVDLTFILLIVFMIISPTLENAVDVSPPEMSADEIKSENFRIINLQHDGSIMLGKTKTKKTELARVIRSLPGNDIEIYIRADESRPYGEVMELMKIVKNCGIQKVSLVTEAE